MQLSFSATAIIQSKDDVIRNVGKRKERCTEWRSNEGLRRAESPVTSVYHMTQPVTRARWTSVKVSCQSSERLQASCGVVWRSLLVPEEMLK